MSCPELRVGGQVTAAAWRQPSCVPHRVRGPGIGDEDRRSASVPAASRTACSSPFLVWGALTCVAGGADVVHLGGTLSTQSALIAPMERLPHTFRVYSRAANGYYEPRGTQPQVAHAPLLCILRAWA